LNQPEVINDFAYRAIHVEAVIGKAIIAAYYGKSAAKSYFLSCSTGGRQGTQAALKYPGDFDGIVAGAPATDWNNLLGWSGRLSNFLGVPQTPATAAKFLQPIDWAVVSAEILRQCDHLDGLVDGIISEPDDCDFCADTLLCKGNQTTGCLTATQVKTVTNIFSPMLGSKGEVAYPRFTPGAEADVLAPLILGSTFFPVTAVCLVYFFYSPVDSTDHGSRTGKLMQF
jgi:hypothetical protein